MSVRETQYTFVCAVSTVRHIHLNNTGNKKLNLLVRQPYLSHHFLWRQIDREYTVRRPTGSQLFLPGIFGIGWIGYVLLWRHINTPLIKQAPGPILKAAHPEAMHAVPIALHDRAMTVDRRMWQNMYLDFCLASGKCTSRYSCR